MTDKPPRLSSVNKSIIIIIIILQPYSVEKPRTKAICNTCVIAKFEDFDSIW